MPWVSANNASCLLMVGEAKNAPVAKSVGTNPAIYIGMRRPEMGCRVQRPVSHPKDIDLCLFLSSKKRMTAIHTRQITL